MTEKEIQEIYHRLLELTKSRAIRWKKTGEAEYSVSFSRSSVTVEKNYMDIDSGVSLSVLKIFNEEGVPVAYAAARSIFYVGVEGAKPFILDPSELFNLVEEEIYKYSQTSENILNELRELELLQKGE